MKSSGSESSSDCNLSKDFLYRKADDLYDQGDFKSAFDLFMRAAQLGDTSSMSRVALMFFNGEGVERNIEKSISWDKKAIEGGERMALCNLGITHQMIGDYKSAEAYFERAIANGNGYAAFRLAKLYIEDGQDVKAIIDLLNMAIRYEMIGDDDLQEATQLLSDQVRSAIRIEK